METAGYIIVGAICERITFWAFLLCGLFIGAILYPISGCWTWGGGWLSQLGSTMNMGHGYVDFAAFSKSMTRAAQSPCMAFVGGWAQFV